MLQPTTYNPLPSPLNLPLAPPRRRYDLARQQPAAGPFGSPDRYDSFAYPRRRAAGSGAEERIPLFERPIGVHRMAYSYVCEPPRGRRPPIVHFAPHASLTAAYLPVVCGAGAVCPLPLSGGSVKAIDRRRAYWAFRIVKHSAKGLVWNRCLEMIRDRQVKWEARGAKLLESLDDDDLGAEIEVGGVAGSEADGEGGGVQAPSGAVQEVGEALDQLARDAVADWWVLLDEMHLQFGDGYEWARSDEDGSSLSKPVEYPVEWLERVAAWEQTPPPPAQTESEKRA